ncbi:MAG: trigger factor [Proteobacteria bacterium]|nr:trigger factor [Pseudomonadota bacterium]MBU4470256.1 trigger factor [Pseudomonadota bacterium]MCG2752670.1 trigger factor [Desulfobacteraceae bacterium]
MNVIVEDISAVKKKINIELPQELVAGEMNDAFKKLQKTAKLKGFRPGKAPRAVLERVYQKDVAADVASKLIQESVFKAIENAGLKIVAQPEINPPDLENNKPYAYSASVEIYPEIQDVEFKGFSLKKTLYEAGDQQIELQLKMVQKNMASQKPIENERPVQADDFVLIHYEGFKDDKPFEETLRTENFTLKVGAGTIAKEFDDQLLGMKAGEQKDFVVAFPEDYFNPKLAGLSISFKVELTQIREEILPEINDEFARKLGKYETLDEVKSIIRQNIESGNEKRTEQELNEQIFQALMDQAEFQVPDALINMELENIIAETEQSLSYQNMSLEHLGMTRETLGVRYRDTAEKQVRRHLILDKIIDQEKLDLTDDEMDKGMVDMAESVNQNVEQIKQFYSQNPDKKLYFKQTILEKKALSLIIENSIIEDVKPPEDPISENTGD